MSLQVQEAKPATELKEMQAWVSAPFSFHSTVQVGVMGKGRHREMIRRHIHHQKERTRRRAQSRGDSCGEIPRQLSVASAVTFTSCQSSHSHLPPGSTQTRESIPRATPDWSILADVHSCSCIDVLSFSLILVFVRASPPGLRSTVRASAFSPHLAITFSKLCSRERRLLFCAVGAAYFRFPVAVDTPVSATSWPYCAFAGGGVARTWIPISIAESGGH